MLLLFTFFLPYLDSLTGYIGKIGTSDMCNHQDDATLFFLFQNFINCLSCFCIHISVYFIQNEYRLV